MFYIGAFLTGLCAAFFSSAITITLFNKWFAKGQATLLAVSMTIGALVGTLGSRWVGGLISGNGYVSALRTIAIGMLIVTVIVRALLRLDPAKLGIKPCWSDEKAAEAVKDTKAAVEVEGVTMKEAMKTYNFYATYQNLNVYMRVVESMAMCLCPVSRRRRTARHAVSKCESSTESCSVPSILRFRNTTGILI